MELTLKMHDVQMTILKEFDDCTIDEMYQMFGALLISATYSQAQIDNYIIEKAEELKEDIKEDYTDNYPEKN
jgi:hypothetical protein